MTDNLKGKVAVVTGSGQGIGRSIAIGMAREGASVVTNNRRPGSTGFAIMSDDLVKNLGKADLESLMKEAKQAAGDAETTAETIRDFGGKAEAFFGDVSDFETARALVRTAVDTFGRIDILVNVVGTFAFSPIWEMSEETWDKVCSVKPRAYFNCIRHALPFMMEQKSGRIINCTSGAFKWGGMRQANYSAASAGVMGLTYAVAQEVATHGITCNAFAPGARTRAGFELDAYEKALPEGQGLWSQEVLKLPISDSPSPDDIAPFICYLSTDDAADITGSVFFVIGSAVMLYGEMDFISDIAKPDGRWTVDELRERVPKDLMKGFRSSTMQMLDTIASRRSQST
ncbi:MAG: SDR family NAD(P)-dependent oxidoreductase [Thermoleophilia bacterium]|nr:SDR family NAD(P)-dependent oxidoreductase [Thermoleophilia bacterium]